jgi:hypothetical protein
MSHDRPPDEFPFAGLAPPGLPPELRERVLAVAREALAGPGEPDVWTRIWESRPLRIVWAVAASLLVIANIGISGKRPSGVAVSRHDARVERDMTRELSSLVALPPIDETVRPLVGRAAADTSSPERKPATPGGGMS